ncbi:MAG: Esa1p-associated factor [Sarea resinae]|nr:MAG: Esa1p-associated factor [Sarea resinae]
MVSSSQPLYAKDERVLCFHHDLLYEAKVLDSRLSDPNDKKSASQYRVHYKGWKNTWDDWVPQDRLKKLTEENKELANIMKKDMDALRNRSAPKSVVAGSKKKAAGSDFSSARGSEERHSSVQAPSGGPRGQKRGRDYEIEKEEAFHTRPSVRLNIPDHLKALLVDDWENITKNLQLVPLPAKYPVNAILDAYFADEVSKRRAGSAEADVLEEVVHGMKAYFAGCLGRILLYRFEREQFYEIRQLWETATTGEWAGKGVGDCYGAEHLCRLFVTMPELIAQTNMDAQSVLKLRDELSKMTTWLGKNSSRYFADRYENATVDYIEKARGGGS